MVYDSVTSKGGVTLTLGREGMADRSGLLLNKPD